MDNTLHLERFADDREGWIAENPEAGATIKHPHLYTPILRRLEAENNALAYSEIENDAYAYSFGKKLRSELLQPKSEAERELQQLVIDEIDFSNDAMGYKFENGRWILPKGTEERILQADGGKITYPARRSL